MNNIREVPVAGFTPLIPKPQTAADVLDIIDQFLAENTEAYFSAADYDSRDSDEVSALWDVLTALRGPDSGDDKVKSLTTQRIRGLALPRTVVAAKPAHRHTFTDGSVGVAGGALFDTEGQEPNLLDERVSKESYHFRAHARNAADALKHIARERAAKERARGSN